MFGENFILLLARVPRPITSLLGYCLGWLFWIIPNSKRRIAYINLSTCLPELLGLKRHNLVRKSLIHETQTMFEMPSIMTLKADRVAKLITKVSGLEYLQQAMAKGHGTILAIPHLGNWEIVGLYCSSLYPMTSLYKPQHRSPKLDMFIRKARERIGATLVPTDNSGVRALYKALGNNHVLGILPDQNPGESGSVFAPFFGQPANTMVLIPRLAKKNKSTVLFCYAERLGWRGGFHVRFTPAADSITDADPLIATSTMNLGLEKCIREVPQQYWWSYKRFKQTPDGFNSAYYK